MARTLALGLWRPTLLLMAVGALSLLARYRRADGRQRQQIKWLAYVAVPLAVLFLVQLRWNLIGLLGAVVTGGRLLGDLRRHRHRRSCATGCTTSTG